MADTAQVAQSILEVGTLQNGTAQVAQSILEVAVGLGVVCNSPPDGQVGVPYTHTFLSGAGDPPLSWSIVNGPAGLTIDASTGVYSGTPSQSGDFTVTVTVLDSLNATASVNCSFSVRAQNAAPLSGGGGFRGMRPSSCGCSPEILAAEKLRRLSVRKRAFPYAIAFPAPQSVTVELVEAAAVPGAGLSVVMVSYTVPEGFRFILQGVLQDYAGGGAAFLAGDALWTLDINTPVGIPNVQAMPIQGMTDIPIPLGSIAEGRIWSFVRPYVFAPLTLVQSKATNVNLAGGFFHSGLFGYLIPDVPK